MIRGRGRHDGVDACLRRPARIRRSLAGGDPAAGVRLRRAASPASRHRLDLVLPRRRRHPAATTRLPIRPCSRHPRAATAAWPPLYPAFLALVQSFAGDSIRAAQLSGVVDRQRDGRAHRPVGRRIAGDGIGLVAAALAAISPMLIAADGSLMSETLFVPLALGTLLLALAAARTQRVWLWIAAGALAGLAALTRAKGCCWCRSSCCRSPGAASARLACRGCRCATAVAGAALVVVVAPWVARNAQRVDEPTIANVSSSTAIAGANCRQTYGATTLGSWEFACIRDERRAATDRARLDVRPSGATG